MDAEPAGDYIALVVRLQEAADGKWYIHVDGTSQVAAIPLAPVTLVVRLWRAADTGLLRGTIGLHGSNLLAPIQSNAQLEELTRAWLSIGGSLMGGP